MFCVFIFFWMNFNHVDMVPEIIFFLNNNISGNHTDPHKVCVIANILFKGLFIFLTYYLSESSMMVV